MPTQMKLSENIDKLSSCENKETLFETIKSIISQLRESSPLPLDPPHKFAVILDKPSLLDYSLKRTINGSMVENQKTQKNFLVAANVILTTFKPQIPLKPLIKFILETCHSSNAVNKTEKQFFTFAGINLFFRIYELFAETTDKSGFDGVSAYVVEQMAKNVHARSFLAAALTGTSFYDGFHVRIVEKVISTLSVQTSHDLDLLINIKLDCLESWKSISENELKKSVNKITVEVNHKLKEVYSVKFLLKLFEGINKDPNMQEEDRVPLIYSKIADLYLSHKDAKVKSLLEFYSIIEKNEKQKGGITSSKLANFVLLLAEIFGKTKNLNNLIASVEANEMNAIFESAMHAVLASKNGKSRKLVSACNLLQENLSRVLLNKEIPSERFQLVVLKLIYAKRDLSAGHFAVKDVLLHKLDNMDVKLAILAGLQEELDSWSNIAKLSDFKALVSKMCVLLPSISSEKSVKTVFLSFFGIYTNAKTQVEKFTDDFKEHSKEFLLESLQSFLFEKISQVIFRKPFRKILRSLIENWMQQNQVDDEFSNLSLAGELETQTNKKADSLALLNMILLFQNYQSEEQDIESLIFSQSMEDVAIFSQNYLTTEGKLDSSDFRILTDVLVSMLNCPNHEIRVIVKDIFEGFLHLMDDQIFELVENAVFNEQKEEDSGEEEESEEDVVENGGQSQSSEEALEEEGEEEESDQLGTETDIVIGGKFF